MDINLKNAICIGGPNELLHIDEIYAFISKDENGNEGICTFKLPEINMMFAMVIADLNLVNSLRPIAIEMAQMSKMQIRLVKFSTRTELEIYESKS